MLDNSFEWWISSYPRDIHLHLFFNFLLSVAGKVRGERISLTKKILIIDSFSTIFSVSIDVVA